MSTFRPPTFGANGMVAAPHYLASLAGASALRDGGSAIDAAIAANLVMCVVWPHMCGVGGDIFAQVWSARDGELHGFNGSGRSGAAMTLEAYQARGLSGRVPQRGTVSITVPGAVDGWFALHARFGRLDMERLARDAIGYARDGFAVSPRVCSAIAGNADLLGQVGGAADVYMPGGAAPSGGDRLVQADLARTLDDIVRQGPDLMYRGELGERVVAFLAEHGSLLAPDDFANHRSDWPAPLRQAYRGAEVAELPPNTQGIALLQMLGMLADADVTGWGRGTGTLVHELVERKKLAFADRDRYVSDPAVMDMPVDRLLEPGYCSRRAREIGAHAAERTAGGPADDGDTVYLCAADRDGNMISLIQSLFSAWGSGVLVPGTGVTLQNRGFSFRLVEGHVNVLAPGKRPMHTLMPGFALRDGKPWFAFGTRGADGQPQTGVQVVTNVIDFGLDPQASLEEPRWVHGAPDARFPREAVVLESRFGEDTGEDLRARGHTVVVAEPLAFVMGTAQVIQVDQARGCYVGGSDPRGDGVALAI